MAGLTVSPIICQWFLTTGILSVLQQHIIVPVITQIIHLFSCKMLQAPDNMKNLLKNRIFNEYKGNSPAGNSFSDAMNSAQVWVSIY